MINILLLIAGLTAAAEILVSLVRVIELTIKAFTR